jgi:hypothetical protein
MTELDVFKNTYVIDGKLKDNELLHKITLLDEALEENKNIQWHADKNQELKDLSSTLQKWLFDVESNIQTKKANKVTETEEQKNTWVEWARSANRFKMVLANVRRHCDEVLAKSNKLLKKLRQEERLTNIKRKESLENEAKRACLHVTLHDGEQYLSVMIYDDSVTTFKPHEQYELVDIYVTHKKLRDIHIINLRGFTAPCGFMIKSAHNISVSSMTNSID